MDEINPPLPSASLDHARGLRKRQTDAESKPWYFLRAGRLDGFKFRRQHPLPPYVVDFFCESAKLVVEADGSQHHESADASRDSSLSLRGYLVLRFWDHEVLQQTEAVLERILSAAQERTLSPSPSPDGRGEKCETEA